MVSNVGLNRAECELNNGLTLGPRDIQLGSDIMLFIKGPTRLRRNAMSMRVDI